MTTLDGRLSTLDLTQSGSLQWSVATEPGELLSSSIHRLELTNNGKYVRMIPSLSGGIYKFDGDSIEAIPVTAEDLLKSSFKFSDDMVISGGKEVRSYGINSRTGNVVYECAMSGCRNLNMSESSEDGNEIPAGHDPLLDDILVLKRHTQTVRAIAPRSGGERWNFSIGHHELELLPSDNCQAQDVKNDALDQLILDFDMRVIVPDGIICGFSKASPNNILWTHKFDAPIVSVHRMDENNRMYSVDLFKNVQWLWKDKNFPRPPSESKLSPSVYLGMYQQQLYIQESDGIKSSLEHHKQLENNLISDETDFPKIPFRPYPASNTAMVKHIKGKKNSDGNDDGSRELTKIDEKLHAQAVLYASQYAEGKGFYFYTENDYNHSMQCGKRTRSTNISPEDFDNVTFQHHGMLARNSSLWDYWKEISVIALTTAFVLNVMLNNRRTQDANGVVYVAVPFAKDAIEYEEEEQKKKDEEEMLRNEVQAKIRSASESNTYDPYVSRFLTDFDLVQCLGKGGFGVVFEVKNKLDDCHYAIKRILLPTKKESRERVMREVKTLANCEHKNIVRYFHAWVEQPPKGWQEVKDKELLTRDILSTSITIDSPSPTEESKAFAPPSEKFTSNSHFLMNLERKNEFEEFGRSAIVDDSSSFIQFKADTNDEEQADDDDDESFEIEFKDSTQTSLSEAPSEASHVISIKDTDDGMRKGHRRQMSLDLPSVSEAKPRKPSLAGGGVTNKIYLYIQMQLCMKNSLKDWLRANDLQMRSGKTYEVWSQIIEAVHYVHLKGLIHRDLKPSNIFFALDGQIKIGDFGLVTDMAEIPVDPLTSSSSNSSANMGDFDFCSISQKKHTQRVGTSLYMSPEQSKGLSYNYKVDIFSLGLILFELLNFFHTETERYKVLENIRKHIFPSEFVENFKDEVRENSFLKFVGIEPSQENGTKAARRAKLPKFLFF